MGEVRSLSGLLSGQLPEAGLEQELDGISEQSLAPEKQTQHHSVSVKIQSLPLYHQQSGLHH
jgi:hypothetical protein